MTLAKNKFLPVTSKDVCLIYGLLLKRGLVSFPLTQDGRNKVDGLVANITSSYFGQETYATNEEKALAYLYFIIKDHAFTDGNKRTACLVFVTVCELNNLIPKYGDSTLDEVAVFIEKIKEPDHHIVIKRLAGLLF